MDDDEQQASRFMGRATCPVCGRSKLVNKQGVFRKHVDSSETSRGGNRPS